MVQKSLIAKNGNFAKNKNIFCKNGRFCKRQEVKTMQTLKGIVTDKNFWIGCAVGFAFGAMHHYFGL